MIVKTFAIEIVPMSVDACVNCSKSLSLMLPKIRFSTICGYVLIEDSEVTSELMTHLSIQYLSLLSHK